MKSISKVFFVLIAVFAGLNTVKAQTSPKDDKADRAAEVQKYVQQKDYVFEATNKGGMPLSYHKYNVAIDKDTLVANLPGLSKGPLKIASTDYAYSEWKGKAGYEIVIKPKAGVTSDVKQIRLEVTPQGHASVRVVSNHGPLALNGYVKQEDY